MRFRAHVFVALAAAFLAGAPAATQAAPDNTLGMAILSAYVDAGGTLGAGSGTTGSVIHPSTGIYDVQFDRDVSGCFHVVASDNFALGRVAQAVPVPPISGVTYVRILTSDAGAFANNGFYLVVYCPR